MPTSPDQIDLWRQAATETQRLEFKEAKNQYDSDKLYRYCVAIANEGGGQFLLGVQDRPPRQVVGSRAFPDPIGTAERVFTHVGFRVDVEEVQHPDGRVLVFHIPSRPRGTAYHLNGAYLMRSGESLVPMSEDQLRRIFAEGAPDWLEEVSKAGLSAEQVVELLDTQAYFELLRLPYPSDRPGVMDRLVQDRLVEDHDGQYSIRRLGALLLSKNLRDFPELARKAARVVVYTGPSKLETKLTKLEISGTRLGFNGSSASLWGSCRRMRSSRTHSARRLSLYPRSWLENSRPTL